MNSCLRISILVTIASFAVVSSARAGEPPKAPTDNAQNGTGDTHFVSPTGEEPTADAKAHAQILFDDAVKLTESGNFKEACPMFAESLRLDSGIGTLLYLSDCQEQLGNTASAWGGFREAIDLARRKHQPDREKIAADRAAKLEPKLSMLKIDVAAADKSIGVVVKRNGAVVGDAAWGDYFPVDPGPQTLEASAPGYEPWTGSAMVESGPTKTEVLVPALVKAKSVAAPSAEGDGLQTGFIMKVSGISLGGVGAVGIALGIGFGVDAMTTYSSARDTCVNDDPTQCTPAGVSMQRSASRSALVSTVAFSVGTTALVGGALLFFLAPNDDEPTTPKVGVSFDDRGAFITLGGAL